MTIDDLEKFKKGYELMDKIYSCKMIVAKAEIAIKDSTIKGTLFTEGDNPIRIPLNNAATLWALNMLIADYKENIKVLEKEFEEL